MARADTGATVFRKDSNIFHCGIVVPARRQRRHSLAAAPQVKLEDLLDEAVERSTVELKRREEEQKDKSSGTSA